MDKVNNSPSQVLKAIQNSKNIVTFIDARFDFDGLCSVLALKHYINSLQNKTYTVYFLEELPKKVKNLFDLSFVTENTHPSTVNFDDFDLAIFIDSNNASKITKDLHYELESNIKIVNIDHHRDNTYFGTINYVMPQKASACSVLFDLFKKWKVEIDTQLATYLMYGIVTDTGNFQNLNVTADDMHDVAELLQKGADLYKIMKNIADSDDEATIAFKKITYNNLSIDRGNKVVYSYATQQDLFNEKITGKEVSSYPVDLLTKIEGVDFAVFVKEKEVPGTFSISFRSIDATYDVQKIAQKFGGGGHKAAAGGKVEGYESLEKLIRDIMQAKNDLQF